MRANWILLFSTVFFLGACQKLMEDQPRYEAYEASEFFKDGNSSRPLEKGTIPRGGLNPYPNAAEAKAIPLKVTSQLLKRGQERYQIYCSVCHSPVGDGNGLVTERGFPKPPSFHQDRLRDINVGHFYQVITNGFGRMYRYGDRISPDDRWAIIAYIRALQMSQNFPQAELSSKEKALLKGEQK